jgi:hypothetical protein
MKNIFIGLIITMVLIGCKNSTKGDNYQKTKETDYQEITNHTSTLIDSLYIIDQKVQNELSDAIQNGENEKINKLLNQQKITFNRHIPILKEIYNKTGYPTVDKVGKESSSKFFTLVQHSDSDVKFQEKMLTELTKELENVSAKDYAFLTDRVKIAQKKPQIYGTQLDYNTNIGQAFPKNLFDSINVNKRRYEIGLESIEEYLNKASKSHFKMSKPHYDKIGVTEPKLYVVKEIR